MLKILGYADRLSVAPGETVRFMVSVEGGRAYQAEIVRIIHGDANPAGPGLKLRPVKSTVDGGYQGREQRTDAGSYATIPDHPRLQSLSAFTVAAMIWPTTPDKPGEQALISLRSPDGEQGFGLSIVDGELALFLGRRHAERDHQKRQDDAGASLVFGRRQRRPSERHGDTGAASPPALPPCR